MSTIKKITQNTVLLSAASFISLGIGFVINFYIARYFSLDSFGIINWALNLSTLLTMLADVGVGVFLTVELARRPEHLKTYLNNALSFKFILCMIGFLLVIAGSLLANHSGIELTILVIIGLYAIVLAITQLLQSTFQAFQCMEHMSVSQMINGFILLAGTFLVITLQSDIVFFAVIYLVSGLAVFLYNLLMMFRSYYSPRPCFDLKVWKMLVISGLPFSIGSIFAFLCFRIDIQLLKWMLDNVAVANYSAAYKLVEAVIVIPSMFCTAVFPVISLYFHQQNPNLNVLLEKSIKYLYIIGLPITLGMILLADQFIFFFYGDKYSASIAVLQALSLGMFIIVVNYVPSSFLSGTNMQKTYMYITIIMTVVNVALNLLVIPVYGIVGSAYTMFVTHLINGVLTFHVLRKGGYRYPGITETLKITAAAVIMGVFVYLIRDQNLAVIIILAAILYFTCLLVSRALTRDDYALLMSIVKKAPE